MAKALAFNCAKVQLRSVEKIAESFASFVLPFSDDHSDIFSLPLGKFYELAVEKGFSLLLIQEGLPGTTSADAEWCAVFPLNYACFLIAYGTWCNKCTHI
jgi:hypothetical protein